MPTRYKVVAFESVAAELQELLAYIKERFGKAAAVKLRMAYKSFAKSLAKHPYKYPRIPESPLVRRAVLLSRTVVYYMVEGNTVTILTVMDGRREAPEW